MKKWVCAMLCVWVLLCLSSCAEETETVVVPEYVLTYADNQPENYPTTLGAERFAALVKERTGGKVVIQLKFGGELGTEREVLEQLKFGGIDFARLSLAGMADELPELNVLLLPFLFEDSDHLWRVIDGQTGEELLHSFEQIGMVGLSWYDGGARSFYSDEVPIYSPEDLVGLTVRVQDSGIVMEMVELLGAEPVTFSYSDVYYAFQTEKINVAENNWAAYCAMEHYKVARYYTVDEHNRVPEAQLASGETWSKLPEEYQQILLECAKESARYERELWREREIAARSEVCVQGCVEIRLTEEAVEQFKQAVQPLYEKYGKEYRERIEQIQNG